jgi:hypothetical protein
MSVQDFILTAAPLPDWLPKRGTAPNGRGLDALTPDEINAEIAAHRHEKESTGREAK